MKPVIQAKYVEYKMVKTRNAMQVILEVELEEQALVHKVLGYPLPGTTTWVAVVPLTTEQKPGAPVDDEERARTSCIMLCKEPEFWQYLEETHSALWKKVETDQPSFHGEEVAAEVVRTLIGGSRSKIATDASVLGAWDVTKADFIRWKQRRS